MLWLIRHWLKAPVHETNECSKVVVSGGRKTKVGTPQGGVISPLLANIYFRRFLLAWDKFGFGLKFRSRIVNYADDFVILCRERANEALQAARNLIAKLGLTLNEEKTRVCQAGETPFNFLGYTFERLYCFGGKPYMGMRPSDKSASKYRESVQQLTARDQTLKQAETVVKAINRVVRGYWNYYCLGTSKRLRWELNQYTRYKVWRWMLCKHTKPLKRTGAKQSGSPELKARVKATQQLLINGMNIPDKSLGYRGNRMPCEVKL